jgi:hypothetical protein
MIDLYEDSQCVGQVTFVRTRAASNTSSSALYYDCTRVVVQLFCGE